MVKNTQTIKVAFFRSERGNYAISGTFVGILTVIIKAAEKFYDLSTSKSTFKSTEKPWLKTSQAYKWRNTAFCLLTPSITDLPTLFILQHAVQME